MTPVNSLLHILLWADTCYALQLRLGLWVVAASLPHRLSTDRASVSVSDLLSPPCAICYSIFVELRKRKY